MLDIDKYGSKDITVSTEGFFGYLGGFLTGLGATMLAPPGFGMAGHGVLSNVKVQKLRNEINAVSEQIAKVRNNELDIAIKNGKEIPKSVKEVSSDEIVRGAIMGLFFGPFYGGAKGSEIQNLNSELAKKLKELDVEIEKIKTNK